MIYKQLVDAEAEAQQQAKEPPGHDSRKTSPLPASPEFFLKLSQDLKDHPLNSDFNLSPGACKSLYNALFPQNPTRPTGAIIQALLAKLYESYKKDIVSQIRLDESQFSTKLKEIEKIENGKLDHEILKEQEKDKAQALQRQQLSLQRQLELQQKQQQRQQFDSQQQNEYQQLRQQQLIQQQRLKLQQSQKQTQPSPVQSPQAQKQPQSKLVRSNDTGSQSSNSRATYQKQGSPSAELTKSITRPSQHHLHQPLNVPISVSSGVGALSRTFLPDKTAAPQLRPGTGTKASTSQRSKSASPTTISPITAHSTLETPQNVNMSSVSAPTSGQVTPVLLNHDHQIKPPLKTSTSSSLSVVKNESTLDHAVSTLQNVADIVKVESLSSSSPFDTKPVKKSDSAADSKTSNVADSLLTPQKTNSQTESKVSTLAKNQQPSSSQDLEQSGASAPASPEPPAVSPIHPSTPEKTVGLKSNDVDNASFNANMDTKDLKNSNVNDIEDTGSVDKMKTDSGHAEQTSSPSDSSHDSETQQDDQHEKRVTRSRFKAKQALKDSIAEESASETPGLESPSKIPDKKAIPNLEDSANTPISSEIELLNEEPTTGVKRRGGRRESQRLKKLKHEDEVTEKDTQKEKDTDLRESDGDGDDEEEEEGDGIDDDDEDDDDDEGSPAPSSRTRSSFHRREESQATISSKKRKRAHSPQSRNFVSSSASASIPNKRFLTLVNPLMSNISSNKSASFFINPVNPNDAPNYYELIYEPVDLRTIKAMIKDGRIQNTAELERELQRMFANAVMYNGWDSDVSTWAREMQQDTETLLALFRGAERTAAANAAAAAVAQTNSNASSASPVSFDGSTDDEIADDSKKKKK